MTTPTVFSLGCDACARTRTLLRFGAVPSGDAELQEEDATTVKETEWSLMWVSLSDADAWRLPQHGAAVVQLNAAVREQLRAVDAAFRCKQKLVVPELERAALTFGVHALERWVVWKGPAWATATVRTLSEDTWVTSSLDLLLLHVPFLSRRMTAADICTLLGLEGGASPGAWGVKSTVAAQSLLLQTPLSRGLLRAGAALDLRRRRFAELLPALFARARLVLRDTSAIDASLLSLSRDDAVWLADPPCGCLCTGSVVPAGAAVTPGLLAVVAATATPTVAPARGAPPSPLPGDHVQALIDSGHESSHVQDTFLKRTQDRVAAVAVQLQAATRMAEAHRGLPP